MRVLHLPALRTTVSPAGGVLFDRAEELVHHHRHDAAPLAHRSARCRRRHGGRRPRDPCGGLGSGRGAAREGVGDRHRRRDRHLRGGGRLDRGGAVLLVLWSLKRVRTMPS